MPQPLLTSAPNRRRSWIATTALAASAAIALPLAVAARAQTMSSQKPAAKAAATKTQARTLELPFEKLAYQKSDLPGYQLTLQQCSACHSPEYVIYQPRSSTRAYWQATVDKMVKVFGAPLPADQVAPIVDYLSRTYGADAPPAPAARPAQAGEAAPGQKP